MAQWSSARGHGTRRLGGRLPLRVRNRTRVDALQFMAQGEAEHGPKHASDKHFSMLARIGHALHGRMTTVVREPLPARWVELIHYLNQRERSLGREGVSQEDDS
jgi:hypothetical protein